MLEATTSLREDLEAAVETVTPDENTSVETVAPLENAAETARIERARDEAGRFTKAERDAQQAAVDAQKETPAPQRPARPSSWKKDYQDKWDAIADSDPQMAAYLLEREQQFANGVSTYKAEADRARNIQSLIEPHSARFQHYGVETTEYLGKLLRMDEILATGTPQQKQALLHSIARSVGLLDGAADEIEQPQNGYVPPELLNTVYGLQNKLQAIEQANERAEQTRRLSEVERFAVDHPYLDELTEPMAQLLESGFAKDMGDAYNKALRLNDELYQKHLAEQQQSAEAERRKLAQEAAARARSAAVSPRTSTPTGAVTVSTQGGDVRSAVEAAADRVFGARGRI